MQLEAYLFSWKTENQILFEERFSLVFGFLCFGNGCDILMYDK